MTSKPDDFEAVRTLVATLSGFDAKDQERIIRWAREKLGLAISSESDAVHEKTSTSGIPTGSTEKQSSGARDIKSFVAEKSPASVIQFTATVAYYYRFEAPPAERKETITPDDLQEACRKAGRDRLSNPHQTLINAHNAGLLDKAERGSYRINTVGENLVAMTLPGSGQTKISKKSKGVKSRIKTASGKR